MINLPRFWRTMQSVYEMPQLMGKEPVQLGAFHLHSSEAPGQGNLSLGPTWLPDHFLLPSASNSVPLISPGCFQFSVS